MLPSEGSVGPCWAVRSITGSTGSSLPLNQLELEELDSDVIYLLRSSRCQLTSFDLLRVLIYSVDMVR